MSSEKRLPPASSSPPVVETLVVDERAEMFVLPYLSGEITYNLNVTKSLLVNQHQSISKELMLSNVEVAKAVHVMPAQERTKQVRIVGIVVVIVALGAIVGICVTPAAGASIAAVAGIVVGVFGGIEAYGQYLSRNTAAKLQSPPPEAK